MKERYSVLLYPFLFGVYPVLSLLGHNVQELQIGDTWRALIAALALAVLLVLLFRALTGDWYRSGLLTALFLAAVYSYGHLYNALGSATLAGFVLRRHRVLLPLYAIAFGIGARLILRRVREPRAYAPALNGLAILLLILPAFQIASQGIIGSFTGSATAPGTTGADAGLQQTPDIYWIILDAYGRDDVLQERLGYDSSAFLAGLAARGFIVPSCSSSNYAHTRPSLTSALMMDYLQDVIGESGQVPTWSESPLIQALTTRGYTTVVFNNGYPSVPEIKANVTIVRRDNGLNDFEALLLETSIFSAVEDFQIQRSALASIDPDYQIRLRRYNDILYFLDALEGIPAGVPAPKFVLAHIVAPHGPAVVGPKGQFIGQEPGNGYINQVTYLDGRILQVVDAILANSKTPPVIIIQGDHGPPVHGNVTKLDRFAILNAYHLPQGSQELYASISPINTFRIVMNAYFGGHYDRLPDVKYYSDGFSIKDVSSAELVSGERPRCTK